MCFWANPRQLTTQKRCSSLVLVVLGTMYYVLRTTNYTTYYVLSTTYYRYTTTTTTSTSTSTSTSSTTTTTTTRCCCCCCCCLQVQPSPPTYFLSGALKLYKDPLQERLAAAEAQLAELRAKARMGTVRTWVFYENHKLSSCVK